MKNTPLLAVFSSVLPLISVLLLVGTSGCCVSIREREIPDAPCDIETLIVGDEVFPQGWEQQGLPDSGGAPVSFGVERIGVDFSTPNRGVATLQVYRALDAQAAFRGFDDFLSGFSPRAGETEWIEPSELAFQSQTADQFRLGCSIQLDSNTRMCLFIGQYGVYLVRFHTYMSEDLMTL